jgi:hypothetical protein
LFVGFNEQNNNKYSSNQIQSIDHGADFFRTGSNVTVKRGSSCDY